jgi:hypothetical protein
MKTCMGLFFLGTEPCCSLYAFVRPFTHAIDRDGRGSISPGAPRRLSIRRCRSGFTPLEPTRIPATAPRSHQVLMVNHLVVFPSGAAAWVPRHRNRRGSQPPRPGLPLPHQVLLVNPLVAFSSGAAVVVQRHRNQCSSLPQALVSPFLAPGLTKRIVVADERTRFPLISATRAPE